MAFEDKAAEMAKRLKKLRKEKGLSHEKLANSLWDCYGVSISKDSLANYEKAEKYSARQFPNNGMKVEYLRCFADFYGVSTDYILGISDEPVPEANVQSVCCYTGLSGASVRTLHELEENTVEQNFIKRFLDDLLESPVNLSGIVEYLWQYVNAQKIAESLPFEKKQDLAGNKDLPVFQNGYFVIPAEMAAADFLSYATAEATGSIDRVIIGMAEEMLRSSYARASETEAIRGFRWDIYSEEDAECSNAGFKEFFDEE